VYRIIPNRSAASSWLVMGPSSFEEQEMPRKPPSAERVPAHRLIEQFLSPGTRTPGVRAGAFLLALAAWAVLGSAPAGAAPDPLKIGLLGDPSGMTADVGGVGAVIAARMAVADFGGTVQGRPVQIVSADFHFNPDTAVSIARQWFDVDGVDAIADLPSTPAALAVQEIARQKKKVILVTGASSDDMTGRTCNPYTIHWADANAAIANSTAKAIIQGGGRTWFFLTADFGFGHAMQAAATAVIKANGGQVLGSVAHPTGTSDFSSYLLAARASTAQVIGLASVGGDTINAINQAYEFGLTEGGQKLAGLVVFITDVHAIGLERAQGLNVTSSFYWDQNEVARAWSQRFFAQYHRMPTRPQASTYAVVLQYLRAAAAVGSADGAAVVRQMKTMPVDYFGHPGSIRADGRVLYDLTLYQVKRPGDSASEWDLYQPVHTVSAADANLPLDREHCDFH
jgi:branched-chain amino acid transport system substrate-binding protein